MGYGIDYDATEAQIESNIFLKKDYFEKNLPFEDKKFDKIFLLAVLEHIPIEEVAKPLGLKLDYHRYFQFGWNSIQVLSKK